MSRITEVIFGKEGDLVYDRDAIGVFTAHAILVTGVTIVSPLISDLATVLGTTDVRAGLLMIVYSATVLVTIPVGGVVADKFRPKVAVVPGLMVFGLAGVAIGFVPSFEFILALRIVQAIGLAFSQPVLVALLGLIYNGSREATAQGIRVAADGVVNTVTPVIAGLLFALSWRYPFYLYVLSIPVALWLWYSLPAVDTGTPPSVADFLTDFTSFLVDRLVVVLLVSFFVRYAMLYGMYTYVSVLATEAAGLAVAMVGVLLGSRSVLKTISSTQAGRLVERSNPAPVALLGFGLTGGGLLLMGLVPTSEMLFVGIMIFGAGDGVLSPTQKTLVNRLSPQSYRSSTMSVAFTFQNIGTTGGPIALGAVLGVFGSDIAFALLGGIGGSVGVFLLSYVWAST